MRSKIVETGVYDLDYLKESKLTALTKKNSDFIEGIIKLDSNYGPDLDENKRGSTAWLCKNIKNDNITFKEFIKKIVPQIDKTNSTHLQACVDGRNTIIDRILKRCHNLNDLIIELRKPLTKNSNNHLFLIIADYIKAVKKATPRFNFSFASKFCSYTSYFLIKEDNYSKYDNVVSKILPSYIEEYLDKKEAATAFKMVSKKGENLKESLERRLKIYLKYNKYIDDLIQEVSKLKIELDRFSLDHILWYGYKGR